MNPTAILKSAVVLAKYSKRIPNLGHGPWLYELDVVIWHHRDKLCAVLRNKELGNLNGYVEADLNLSIPVAVHGGVTFTGHLSHQGEHCSLLDVHTFFGFDCAHAGDLVPGIIALSRMVIGTGMPEEYLYGAYRTTDFVIKETHNLAKQLYG